RNDAAFALSIFKQVSTEVFGRQPRLQAYSFCLPSLKAANRQSNQMLTYYARSHPKPDYSVLSHRRYSHSSRCPCLGVLPSVTTEDHWLSGRGIDRTCHRPYRHGDLCSSHQAGDAADSRRSRIAKRGFG